MAPVLHLEKPLTENNVVTWNLLIISTKSAKVPNEMIRKPYCDADVPKVNGHNFSPREQIMPTVTFHP